MSLIIEALKRARDDAVRRQAASKGLPLAPVPRLRGRSRWLTLAIVPLAAALVVCLLLLFDLYTRMPRTTPSATATLAEVPTDDTTSRPYAGEVSDSTEEPPIAVTAESDPSVEAREDVLAVRADSTPASREDPPPAMESIAPAAVDTPAMPSSSSSSPTSRPAAEGVREFIGQAQLIDGQLVDLQGIAWSESDPFALLNGQVVGVGELIRAYRVTEIHRDRVHLEQGDDRIVLRLK